jgi:hypothetical protein
MDTLMLDHVFGNRAGSWHAQVSIILKAILQREAGTISSSTPQIPKGFFGQIDEAMQGCQQTRNGNPPLPWHNRPYWIFRLGIEQAFRLPYVRLADADRNTVIHAWLKEYRSVLGQLHDPAAVIDPTLLDRMRSLFQHIQATAAKAAENGHMARLLHEDYDD